MRKLRVRTHALLGLALLLLLPWICFVTARLATTGSLRLGEDGPDSYGVPLAAAFAGLLLAFLIAGMLLRRRLLLPLEGMGRAARQLAEGDWDVRLPHSAVREIAEVRDGFEAMVGGLRDAGRRQLALEEERRFVIAAVAHDLRTPLFALRGYLDGLEQGIARTPEQIAKYVAVCKEKSALLDRLVEDLFTMTKLDYPDAGPSGEASDLNDIVRKAVDGAEPQARLKGIAIDARYAPVGCAVRADAHLLERAVGNLLDNAVRHAPAHSRIAVECRAVAGRATFAIRDAGAGFAPGELARVFEPLYRGEQSRSRATGGAGLGMTIARRILRRHGGELAAGNHPGGGAELSGWLPALPPASEERGAD